MTICVLLIYSIDIYIFFIYYKTEKKCKKKLNKRKHLSHAQMPYIYIYIYGKGWSIDCGYLRVMNAWINVWRILENKIKNNENRFEENRTLDPWFFFCLALEENRFEVLNLELYLLL